MAEAVKKEGVQSAYHGKHIGMGKEWNTKTLLVLSWLVVLSQECK